MSVAARCRGKAQAILVTRTAEDVMQGQGTHRSVSKMIITTIASREGPRLGQLKHGLLFSRWPRVGMTQQQPHHDRNYISPIIISFTAQHIGYLTRRCPQAVDRHKERNGPTARSPRHEKAGLIVSKHRSRLAIIAAVIDVADGN